MQERIYLAIDLKSFYASAECVERKLDPLTTHLVVADRSRTERTICLAVSPSLKSYGIPGRARLFEVDQKVREINAERRLNAPRRIFKGSSTDDTKLKSSPELELAYITATPRMALYMEYSARVYGVYLRYVAPEDMHVYSIDEVFMDVTSYLPARGLNAREFARAILLDVQKTVGIAATAGIGPNLYLCKTALDILAKHAEPDTFGTRIAELDEQSYRRELWSHRPLADFWRVGPGYAAKLARHGLFTMGDIARCSLGGPRDYHNEELLYRLLGVNAELLIDHAWGFESCTLPDIKSYRPRSNSIGSGQVLHRPYPFGQARLVLREMADALSLDLVAQGLATDQLVLNLGYDAGNLRDQARRRVSRDAAADYSGRSLPRRAHGTENLPRFTSSSELILRAATELFDRIADPALLIRRITLTACRLLKEEEAADREIYQQMSLFADDTEEERLRAENREKNWQNALLKIRKKYGKNAILRGMSLLDGATARDRNRQIGGHRA